MPGARGRLRYVAAGGNPDVLAVTETARQREQFRWRRLAGGFEVMLGIQASDRIVVIGGIQAAQAVRGTPAPDADLVDGSARRIGE
jgi:hypothetical protein